MHDDATVLRLGTPGERSASRAAECFADEVAIDFPSLAPLAERLCERFLAGQVNASHQWAEVRLSRDDAAAGRRVPVPIVLPAVCEECGGRGETWQERCGACDGRGSRDVRRDVAVTLPSGVRDGARFLLTVAVADAGVARVQLQVWVP